MGVFEDETEARGMVGWCDVATTSESGEFGLVAVMTDI